MITPDVMKKADASFHHMTLKKAGIKVTPIVKKGKGYTFSFKPNKKLEMKAYGVKKIFER